MEALFARFKKPNTVKPAPNANSAKLKRLNAYKRLATIRNNSIQKINAIGQQQIRNYPQNEALIRERMAYFRRRLQEVASKEARTPNINQKIAALTAEFSGKYYNTPPTVINNYIPRGGRNKTRKNKKN